MSLAERILAILHLADRPTVPISDLKNLLWKGKADTDNALLELARRQLVYLARHDDPFGLDADSRYELVNDGDTYYVTVSLR